jgi:hypothetical protein
MLKDFAILAAKVVVIIAVFRVIEDVAKVPPAVNKYLP